MMDNNDIKEKYGLDSITSYPGYYRGIRFEIKTWINEHEYGHNKDKWTYYIYVDTSRIPVEFNTWLLPVENEFWKKLHYEYLSNSFLSNLEFHGGITYYEKCNTELNTLIKIGCDFSHLADEGIRYRLTDVLAEVENTINDFLMKVPSYGFRSHTDGKWIENEEDIFFKNGRPFTK